MRPGSDELHPLPAQKVSPAEEPKDLDLEELAERALIPGRHRALDTARVILRLLEMKKGPPREVEIPHRKKEKGLS